MIQENKIAITSFYSFVDIENPEILQQQILLVCKKKYVKGTILVAKEGFNGSISGLKENVDLVLDNIIKLTSANDVNIKVNYADKFPFSRLKVKIKKEIITLGIENLDINSLKGEYIEPKDWDKFLDSEEAVLIDTRNDYEVEIGTFKNAINPKTASFREFPKWIEQNKDILNDKKILMCCTGGVRCEKSTAYLRQLGFNEVYHLKGGILQYLEDTGNVNGKWQGECFVFDDRRAVDVELKPCYTKST